MMSCWRQMYSKLIQLYIQALYLYIYFSFWLLQDIEYSSLCYTVGPCCLSGLYNVNLLIPAPDFSLPIPFPFGNHMIQKSHSQHLPGENSSSQKYMPPSSVHKIHASQHYSQ